MNMSMRIAGFALFLALASLRTWAYPNFNATTGILAVPTAETVNAGDLSWAGDILFFDDTTFNGRVIYGLTDQLEVGAGVIVGSDTAIGVSAKYYTGLTIGGFACALGLTMITGDQVGDGTQIYVAGTRPFGVQEENGTGLIGTVGVNFTGVEGSSAFRPFAGAQLRLDTATEVAAEFVLESGDWGDSIFSLLVRQRCSDRLTVQIGLTNAFGFTGTDNLDFFFGAAYTLGG